MHTKVFLIIIDKKTDTIFFAREGCRISDVGVYHKSPHFSKQSDLLSYKFDKEKGITDLHIMKESLKEKLTKVDSKLTDLDEKIMLPPESSKYRDRGICVADYSATSSDDMLIPSGSSKQEIWDIDCRRINTFTQVFCNYLSNASNKSIIKFSNLVKYDEYSKDYVIKCLLFSQKKFNVYIKSKNILAPSCDLSLIKGNMESCDKGDSRLTIIRETLEETNLSLDEKKLVKIDTDKFNIYVYSVNDEEKKYLLALDELVFSDLAFPSFLSLDDVPLTECSSMIKDIITFIKGEGSDIYTDALLKSSA